MKLIRNLSWMILLMWLVGACLTPPEYPTTPQIEILNDEMYFGKSNEGKQDSIVIALKFKDGDGDLGLSTSDDSNEKYALQYYFNYKGKPVTFKTRAEYPELNLPDFVSPYDCTNWEDIKEANGTVTDYRYTEFNLNYYNIFVDFYTQNSDLTFTKFDPASYFKRPFCDIKGYNGRFPILSKDLGKSSPLDGKLIYTMKSLGFEALFSIKTLKLVVTIQDRALNKSNTVETKEFKLKDILRK
jgi:hypothetical protein